MNVIVKKASEVGSKCISATRWFGCVGCNLLKTCTTPESKLGRLREKKNQLADAKRRLIQATEDIRRLEKEIETSDDRLV